jgi:hypothetical protein
MDNSPRNVFLAEGGTGIDISSAMVLFARQLALATLALDRPEDAAALDGSQVPVKTVATCSADERGYRSYCGYWRGAAWAPTDTIMIRGLERDRANSLPARARDRTAAECAGESSRLDAHLWQEIRVRGVPVQRPRRLPRGRAGRRRRAPADPRHIRRCIHASGVMAGQGAPLRRGVRRQCFRGMTGR